MLNVIKKNGIRQAFSEQKVLNAIEASAREAGITEQRTRKIVEFLSRELSGFSTRRNEMESAAIRDFVLTSLDLIEPSVSEAWRSHEMKKSGYRPPLALLPPTRILLLKR